jgi:hypothetical protein
VVVVDGRRGSDARLVGRGDAQGHAFGEGLVDDALGGGGVGERDEEVDRFGVVDDFVLGKVLVGCGGGGRGRRRR